MDAQSSNKENHTAHRYICVHTHTHIYIYIYRYSDTYYILYTYHHTHIIYEYILHDMKLHMISIDDIYIYI